MASNREVVEKMRDVYRNPDNDITFDEWCKQLIQALNENAETTLKSSKYLADVRSCRYPSWKQFHLLDNQIVMIPLDKALEELTGTPSSRAKTGDDGR